MPISLEITLLFASLIKKNKIPQVSRVAKIAPNVKAKHLKNVHLSAQRKR